MRTENATGCGYTPPAIESVKDVDQLMAKVLGGVGIEELILEDTQAQKKMGSALRRMQRDRRRKLVEAAVKKMKDAADDRFWSALTGAFVNAGVATASAFLGGPLTNQVSEAGAKAILGSFGAFGQAYAAFNPFSESAADKDADAKLIQEEAQADGERASDSGEWLATAKDLERRMIDRMEQMTRAEHESRLDVLNRIGS